MRRFLLAVQVPLPAGYDVVMTAQGGQHMAAIAARKWWHMPVPVMFVSVNKTFSPSFTLAELEPWVERAWAMTVAKASACDRVVAVYDQVPVGCWRIRSVFATQETYETTGGPRQRVGLSLGEPLPVLRAYTEVPVLRRGSATVALGVEPLGPERDESLMA